jgi:hypothetical protein
MAATEVAEMMGSRALNALVLACAVLAAAIPSARAEVRLDGTAAALRIEADKAALSDVLAALGPLNVRYRAAIGLQTEISGTYTGSLARVIARLLEAYDYVLRSNQDAVELLIIGKHGDGAIIARTSEAPPPSGLAANPATQWRTPPRNGAPAR